MNTKALRQKILDLAIHGKLVPQDPNDEPASVLLERIRAEKERLIKEGKIKKPKKSKATCDKQRYPYQLPKGWVWCRLEDIATFGGGKTPSMDIKEYWNNGNNLWVTSKDMKNDSIHDSLMKITDEALNIMTQYEKDTLLVVTRSGILRHTLPIAILENNATINQDIKSIMPLDGVIPKFLFYAIKANENIILTEYHKDGTTVDSIDFDKFKCLPIPLPPINEQKRIISEVLKVSAFIDCIDYEKTGLYTAIAQAKSKILDLAIHGKLVPQDPNDEPASELLKRINPKAEITCDNPRYGKLPKGWCETLLEYIGTWQSGATPSRLRKDYYNGDIPWLKTGDLNDGLIKSIPETITKRALEETSVKLNPTGSVLIAMYGATIGKIGILAMPATTNQACCACVNYMCDKMFLFYFLLANRERFIAMGGGGAQPNISKEKIINTHIPLPPLVEQHRIVTRIEELFAQLDKMEASL